jgi:hypothetical protein
LPQLLAELPDFIRVGKAVYRTWRRGRRIRIVITRVPCFADYVPTPAQRARRSRLREATAFAQRVYADPAAKAFYVAAAHKLGRQPFRLAVSDYLRGDARLQAREVMTIAHADEKEKTLVEAACLGCHRSPAALRSNQPGPPCVRAPGA